MEIKRTFYTGWQMLWKETSRNFLGIIIKTEGWWLLITTFAFWYASPIRDNWVWLIALIIPIFMARWLLYRRLWTDTPLNEFLVGFIALCVLNIFTAPYETRGMILLFRPMLGIALIIYLIEYARRQGHLRHPLLVTLIGANILGVAGLTATEWSEGKTAFSAITALLPVYTQYPGVEGLFNANEIAGAITWIAPLTVGLTFYYHQRKEKALMGLAGIGAALLLLALLLGQSLSGILGVAAGLLILLTPRRLRVFVSGAVLSLFILAQTLILVSPSMAVQIAGSLSGRSNLNSLEHREVIWTSARQAVIDHPLTGIGMAMYRNPVVWEIYPTPGYDRYDAPHAHNEILHIATDLGLPGALLFIGWYLIAGYMVYIVWKRGDADSQNLATAVAAGLVAHMIYGLTDAIPLWDRFAFILYWLLGMIAAQYVLTRQAEASKYSESDARA
jgi:hypothetical protein